MLNTIIEDYETRIKFNLQQIRSIREDIKGSALSSHVNIWIDSAKAITRLETEIKCYESTLLSLRQL